MTDGKTWPVLRPPQPVVVGGEVEVEFAEYFAGGPVDNGDVAVVDEDTTAALVPWVEGCLG